MSLKSELSCNLRLVRLKLARSMLGAPAYMCESRSLSCSVDATAHCMHAEDCVGWTEDCQASQVREDCKDARSWGACWFA